MSILKLTHRQLRRLFQVDARLLPIDKDYQEELNLFLQVYLFDKFEIDIVNEDPERRFSLIVNATKGLNLEDEKYYNREYREVESRMNEPIEIFRILFQ